LGPNGAGKSTLIKVLLGLVRCTSGRGRLLQYPLGTGWAKIRARVGYMPEDDCYIPGLTGVEMVAYLARLSGLPSVEALRRAHEILDYAGIEQERYRLVETYSTGMRQKLKFAQAVVHDPPVLILDEPTAGLDPRERQIMLRRIVSLAHEHGKMVLVSTHILPDVQATCDRVVIMSRGQVRVSERLEVLRRPSSPSCYVKLLGDERAFIRRAEAAGVRVEREPDGGLVLLGIEPARQQQLWRWAAEVGAGIRVLRQAQNSLEKIFVEAVGDTKHVDA
jgi:ABC-2 type transport system ATP-binding protein